MLPILAEMDETGVYVIGSFSLYLYVCIYVLQFTTCCICTYTDDNSRQLAAFKGLVQLMNTAKQSSLKYIYQEYEVCVHAGSII